jgi:hypothetical protein
LEVSIKKIGCFLIFCYDKNEERAGEGTFYTTPENSGLKWGTSGNIQASLLRIQEEGECQLSKVNSRYLSLALVGLALVRMTYLLLNLIFYHYRSGFSFISMEDRRDLSNKRCLIPSLTPTEMVNTISLRMNEVTE